MKERHFYLFDNFICLFIIIKIVYVRSLDLVQDSKSERLMIHQQYFPMDIGWMLHSQSGSTDTKRLAQSSLTTVLASSHCQFLFISIKIIFMVNRKLQFLPAPLKSCYQQWPMWCFQNGGPSSEPFLHTLTRYQLKLWTCAFAPGE